MGLAGHVPVNVVRDPPAYRQALNLAWYRAGKRSHLIGAFREGTQSPPSPLYKREEGGDYSLIPYRYKIPQNLSRCKRKEFSKTKNP